MYLWTSEFVSAGHPDKVADQVADAILDAYLTDDPMSRVACEVTITAQFALVTGEVDSIVRPDIEAIVRRTLVDIGYGSKEVGFDGRSCDVVNKLHVQSDQIRQMPSPLRLRLPPRMWVRRGRNVKKKRNRNSLKS